MRRSADTGDATGSAAPPPGRLSPSTLPQHPWGRVGAGRGWMRFGGIGGADASDHRLPITQAKPPGGERPRRGADGQPAPSTGAARSLGAGAMSVRGLA